MFRIIHAGAGRDDVRVQADAPLTPDDFERIARELVRPVMRARKVGYVAARPARNGEMVETHWNGKETTNTARRGDWVVVNLSPERAALRDRDGHENIYVIAGKRFDALYERAEAAKNDAGRQIYRAKGSVRALRLPGGFDIVAPWGERQISPAGYLLCNGSEVYGNHAETFAATYEVLG